MMSFSQSTIRLTQACPLKCLGCPLWESSKSAARDPIFDSILDHQQWSSFFMSTGVLNIIGGDPLLVPELTHFLTKLKQQLLHTRLYLWTSAQSGIDAIKAVFPWIDVFVIYIPSSIEEDYALHTGEDGLTSLKRTFSACKKSRIPFVLNHPIRPSTVWQLPDIHLLAKEYGVPLWIHYDPLDHFFDDSIAYINRYRGVEGVLVFKRHTPPPSFCQAFPYGGIDHPLQLVNLLFRESFNGIRKRLGL